MIITLIFAIILVLGIVITGKCGYELSAIGVLLTIFGLSVLPILLIAIIVSHSTADKTIQQNRIDHYGLCKRYEIIKSDYEDVSKSEVIADITEWNKKVYNTKYWAENPWTNWFNPKSVADNLAYIPLESEVK